MSVKCMNFLLNKQGKVLSSYIDADIQDYTGCISNTCFRTPDVEAPFTSAGLSSLVEKNGKLKVSAVIDEVLWSGFAVPMHVSSGMQPDNLLLVLHQVTEQEAPAGYSKSELVHHSPSVTYCLDLRQKAITNITPNVAHLAGFSPRDILNRPEWWQQQIHPDDLHKYHRYLESCQSGQGDICGTEYRFRQYHGHYIWLADRTRTFVESDTYDSDILIGSLTDISQMMKQHEQLVSLTGVAPGMIYQYERIADGNINFSYISPQVESLFGRTQDEIKHDIKLLFYAVHPADRKRVYRSIVKAEKKQIEWKCEFRVLNQGEVRWLYGHSVPGNREGERQLWSGLLIDISDKKSLEFKLKRESTTDPLTGLFNRRYFMSILGDVFNSGPKNQLPVSILAIDFDHFKQVNDKYGHDIGDTVLKHIATGMKQNIRKTDTLARIGGEEFSVILPATTYKEATRIAEKLRCYVEEQYIPCQKFEIQITITVGVATSDGELSQKELLISADRALYQGKSSGRNRVV